MAGSFPTGVTTYTNPGPTDTTAAVIGGRTHDQLHGDVQDDLEQVMTKLGTGAGAATANTVLRGTGAGTTAFGQIQAADLAAGVAFGNPMTTQYDLIAGGASGVPGRLAKGANNTVLAVDASGILAYRTIVAADIGAGQVVQGKLASDAVTTATIVDGHVTTAKLADQAVGVAKLGLGAVWNVNVQDNQIVGSQKLYDGSVTTDKLAANAVTQSVLAVGSTGNPTQASATDAVMPQMTVTLTTVGGPVLVIASAMGSNNTAGGQTSYTFYINGVNSSVQRIYNGANGNETINVVMMHLFTGLGAGTYTYDLRWHVDSGVVTSSGVSRELIAIEFKR